MWRGLVAWVDFFISGIGGFVIFCTGSLCCPCSFRGWSRGSLVRDSQCLSGLLTIGHVWDIEMNAQWNRWDMWWCWCESVRCRSVAGSNYRRMR